MSAASTASVPTVVIVGAGASGSLSALHLLRTAARRSTDLEVLLLDPTPRLRALHGVEHRLGDERDP